MTRPKTIRRRRRRAMLSPRRRRFTVQTTGRFDTPAETITYHRIPRG